MVTIMGLPLSSALSLSLLNARNSTYGNISALVGFDGLTANASASFTTHSLANSSKFGLEEVHLELEYVDPSSLFSMDVAVEYNSNCSVGVRVLF